MELLNRDAQKALLQLLAGAFPEPLHWDDFKHFDRNVFRVNLMYLSEHGLARSKFRTYVDNEWAFVESQITAAGMDFLAGDGGLGAILGVQTIRIHEDSIRQLLIAKVEASDADETIKEKLVEQLKSLPAEGLGRLAERALDAGIQALPNAVQWLQTLLPG